MKVEMPFNVMKENITVELPDDQHVQVITPKPVEARSIESEVKRALRNSYFKRIMKKVDEGSRVAILIDDHTRPTPTKEVLPIIINEIEARGGSVEVIYAKGTHEPPPPHFLEKKVSREILEKYSFTMHDAYHGDYTFKGLTSLGTPVWINSLAANADIRIGIGSIFPSEVAGFTGGCKILLPGISSYLTINRNHSLFISPKAKIGSMTENPVRKDIDEAGLIGELNAIINFVMTADGRVVKAFSGHPIKAHRSGVKLCREIYERKIECKADLIIISPGGTEDIDFVQAVKAIFMADAICKDGGTIILVAACPLGTQWPELEEYLHEVRSKNKSREQILKDIISGKIESIMGAILYKKYHLIIEKRKKILVYTKGLNREQISNLGFEPIEDLQSTVNEEVKNKRRILVLPYGAYNWVKVEGD
ncbi:MAG: nickel-dependent lactate racemase [Candidatus Methanomethylicota archaeon]|nr:MAG: nickel-dependent lactate racemase [Candidatus Verstraetearchaeota archaeon]